MPQPTVWERVKTGGKSGFDKTWKAFVCIATLPRLRFGADKDRTNWERR